MRVHHVALRTRDLERLVAFYRRWLALRETRDQRPRSVWLQAPEGGAVLMIERAGDDEPLPPPGGKDLLALAIAPAARTRLRAALLAEHLLEHETDHTLYFRDPDGRRVAVSSYPL